MPVQPYSEPQRSYSKWLFIPALSTLVYQRTEYWSFDFILSELINRGLFNSSYNFHEQT